MSRITKTLSILALLFSLNACCPDLKNQVKCAKNTAEEAKLISQQALEEAEYASDQAAKSADKANKIFQQSQKK